MNGFEKRIADVSSGGLFCRDIDVIQVNVGLRCNQECRHCHLGASPRRTETMTWETMREVIDAVSRAGCRLVDLTGGSPELNPGIRRFITALREHGLAVQLRTNLTVLLEDGMETLPEFLRDRDVALVASMPCYLEENVRAQRGRGVYEKSIEAMRRLNAIGYGVDPRRTLDLVYNPVGSSLPPEQRVLEAEYKRELRRRFNVTFTRLLTITNMPIGRFGDALRREHREDAYMKLLRHAFNPRTVSDLMCRHQLSVAWDGTLYDCDFNLALGQPVDHGAPAHLTEFDMRALASRRIVTGEHCFGCTAGHGSSCRGALV